MERRSLLSSIGSGLAVALAGCSGGGTGTETSTETATSTPTPTSRPTATTASSPYGTWFRNTGNYDGTVDRTGRDEIRVTVGAAGNGGNLAYEPAAVLVSTGTTVVWEWTGKGGQHNVLEREGTFESELVSEADHTFRYRFDDPGTYLYYCVPHKSLGMRGAVRVADGS